MTAPIVTRVAASPVRVLFVVDDVDALRILVEVAEREPGFTWASADSAPDARAQMEAEPADVIVCRDRIAGANGVELLAELRAVRPSLVRVLLSAAVDHDVSQRALVDGGVHAIVAQPWRAEPLAAALKSAATQARAQRIAAATDALAAIRSFRRTR
jgi:response regulator RpfG family c-di-GMP phosphodiesterase